ncbi:hypothetical protein [Novosphingobium sp.]|jgi:hypothetical protein|uniref:hypothetical protein n=1 Tax=Novosphingobium sp. TaxID=1874826 RepID=UPI002FE18284
MCHCGIELTWLPAVITWFYNWQTFITGVMALVAAGLAARPVLKQLALMRTQNNVMVRETIGHMVVALDAQRASMNEIIAKPLSEIDGDIEYHEQYGPPPSIHEWYSAAHSKANGLFRHLRSLFIQSQDAEIVERSKDALLEAAEKLAATLSDICQPIYATIHVTEYEWTEQELAERNAKAEGAENQLAAAVDAVSAATRDLRAAYANQRAVLVRQLRVIDDGLLNSVTLKES